MIGIFVVIFIFLFIFTAAARCCMAMGGFVVPVTLFVTTDISIIRPLKECFNATAKSHLDRENRSSFPGTKSLTYKKNLIFLRDISGGYFPSQSRIG